MKTYTVIIDEQGTKHYYNENGKLHREDGPAVEYTNGRKCWYQNGVLHRTDGPAFEGANHYNQWWINGIEYSEKQFLAKMKLPVIDCEGTKYYYNENHQYHREDGPAMELADGTKIWYKNGQRHREDGPAYEDSNGTIEWYKNNELHREDGPAVERENGDKEWWLNGVRYTEKKFHGKMKLPVIDGFRTKFYYNENGQLHREDGPAIEWIDGDKAWCLYNERYTEYEFNMIMNNPKELELTMTEINKHFGCQVKIVESH